jgi:hypothetical protein
MRMAGFGLLSRFGGAETAKRSMIGLGTIWLNDVVPRHSYLSHRVFWIANSGGMVPVDAYKAGWVPMPLLPKDGLADYTHPSHEWHRYYRSQQFS